MVSPQDVAIFLLFKRAITTEFCYNPVRRFPVDVSTSSQLWLKLSPLLFHTTEWETPGEIYQSAPDLMKCCYVYSVLLREFPSRCQLLLLLCYSKGVTQKRFCYMRVNEGLPTKLLREICLGLRNPGEWLPLKTQRRVIQIYRAS